MEGDAAQRHRRGRQPLRLLLRHESAERQVYGVLPHHALPPPGNTACMYECHVLYMAKGATSSTYGPSKPAEILPHAPV